MLQAKILRICYDEAKTSPEIIEALGPEVMAEWSRYNVMRYVYALENAGFLFKRGTKGAVYLTTRRGKDVLPMYESSENT